MAHQDAAAGGVVFRIRQGHAQSWFIYGSISLEVSEKMTQRSRLLCHFKEQTESDAEVPLALSIQALQAWKTCVDLQAQDQHALEEGQNSLSSTLSDDDVMAGLVVRCSHRPVA